MELSGKARSDAFFVRVDSDRIDAASAIQFKDSFRQAVHDVEGRIILDLANVDFIDSSGLGAVVTAMKLLGAGRRLELSGLTPTVQKVFRLTRMDSVFAIHPDADAALAAGSGRATHA